jgi:hypothetical protein
VEAAERLNQECELVTMKLRILQAKMKAAERQLLAVGACRP